MNNAKYLEALALYTGHSAFNLKREFQKLWNNRDTLAFSGTSNPLNRFDDVGEFVEHLRLLRNEDHSSPTVLAHIVFRLDNNRVDARAPIYRYDEYLDRTREPGRFVYGYIFGLLVEPDPLRAVYVGGPPEDSVVTHFIN